MFYLLQGGYIFIYACVYMYIRICIQSSARRRTSKSCIFSPICFLIYATKILYAPWLLSPLLDWHVGMVHAHVHIYVCIYMYTYVNTYVYICIYMYVRFKRVYTYVCCIFIMHIYIYRDVCLYLHYSCVYQFLAVRRNFPGGVATCWPLG